MRFGFLFGAGAEIGYGLPSGGKFALDIFRQDSSNSKEYFKKMRDEVDQNLRYAADWLPENYKQKNVSSFGKTVFQNIIKDTVEHNREIIIEKVNDFDKLAEDVVVSLTEKGIDIKKAFQEELGNSVEAFSFGQTVSFISEFEKGDRLFKSKYFSALLMVYKSDKLSCEQKTELAKILLSIIQLLVGALSESLTRKINDGVFDKKDDDIDIFDDIGDIVQLNYSSTGLAGMEYLLERRGARAEDDLSNNLVVILTFAQNILENLYAGVLDYKSLIDSNWHYLYSPKTDWAKFCKICIFLLNVRNYISSAADQADCQQGQGYYHDLRLVLKEGKLELTAVATTNYNVFIKKVLEQDVTFLNGSTELWYDPYVNKAGSNKDLCLSEKHILVPLMFTQSGTKPMTSIGMSVQYVETYKQWKKSDAVVVIGYGFGVGDEHINGIIRTLVDEDGKDIIIVSNSSEQESEVQKKYATKLKISTRNWHKIRILSVDKNRMVNQTDKLWIDMLLHDHESRREGI